MVKQDFSCPGKTFLAGEYCVTQAGEALVATTKPCFHLKVYQKISSLESEICSIHPESPAGKLMTEHAPVFKDYQFNFYDPYHGMGGLGASTAQFLMVSQFFILQTNKTFQLEDLYQSYLRYAWSGKGVRPSGADLLAQYQGNISLINTDIITSQGYFWPFEEIEFHLFHTRHKVPTHKHLQQLKLPAMQNLKKIFAELKTAFLNKDTELFCQGIGAYQKELSHLKLTCSNTLRLLNAFNKIDGIITAKGCGASGSDIIMVITPNQGLKEIMGFMQNLNLTWIASSEYLTDGLYFE